MVPLCDFDRGICIEMLSWIQIIFFKTFAGNRNLNKMPIYGKMITQSEREISDIKRVGFSRFFVHPRFKIKICLL